MPSIDSHTIAWGLITHRCSRSWDISQPIPHQFGSCEGEHRDRALPNVLRERRSRRVHSQLCRQTASLAGQNKGSARLSINIAIIGIALLGQKSSIKNERGSIGVPLKGNVSPWWTRPRPCSCFQQLLTASLSSSSQKDSDRSKYIKTLVGFIGAVAPCFTAFCDPSLGPSLPHSSVSKYSAATPIRGAI